MRKGEQDEEVDKCCGTWRGFAPHVVYLTYQPLPRTPDVCQLDPAVHVPTILVHPPPALPSRPQSFAESAPSLADQRRWSISGKGQWRWR